MSNQQKNHGKKDAATEPKPLINQSSESSICDLASTDLPTTVLVNGKLLRVTGIPLGELATDPAMLAGPRMVIPYMAAEGMVTLLAAREKLGKTTYAAYAACAVASGSEIFGQPTEQGVVLWLGLEEQVNCAVKRFVEMQTDDRRMILVNRVPFENPIEQLTAEIIAWRPRLVVIDSLAVFFRHIEDENGASPWTKALVPLTELARMYKTAIVLLHHANKQDGRYRGSSAIGAGMDMILEMTESSDDPRVRLITARGRWSIPAYAVRYEEPSFELVGEPGGDVSAAARTAKQSDLQEKVFAFIASNSNPSFKVEIRRSVGGKAEYCDAALKALVASGRVEFLGNRQGYRALASCTPKKPAKSSPKVNEQISIDL